MIVKQYQKQSNVSYITDLSTEKLDNKIYKIKLTNNTLYYYIKLNFIKQNSRIPIDIYLSQNSGEHTIKIDNFTLSQKSNLSNNYYREIIIPKSILDITDIYLNIDSSNYNIETSMSQCSMVHNILPQDSVNRIGIWGSPSQIACVNGEKIQIGRTGIYELNNPNIKINFVGFIPMPNKNFILDYAYEN